MAFPIPSHLPRASKKPHDVASEILSKIGEATNKSLNASVAASWLDELDSAIQTTEISIHDRIHSDFPQFEQLLESSRSVQTRLLTLTTDIDDLDYSVSDNESGIIPRLMRALSAHSAVAQKAQDASLTFNALSHLLECKKSYMALTELAEAGKLPESMEACAQLEVLLREAPEPLPKSKVMLELKEMTRAVRSRTEEQLDEALSRSVILAPTSLTVRPSVQVGHSETTITLSSIFTSLPPATLTSHLNTLRKGIIAHYIEHILVQPTSSTSSSTPDSSEHTLTLFPDPPIGANASNRLDTLTAVLSFIQEHILSHLPHAESTSFSRSLCKPITDGVLNNLLIASLPSCFDDLPPFLELVDNSRTFEENVILGLLLAGDEPPQQHHDMPIKSWADNVSAHYERHRRMQILDASRKLVYEGAGDEFVVEISVPITIEVEEEEVVPASRANGNAVPVNEDWDFKDEGADAWGFDGEDVEQEKAAEEAKDVPMANGGDNQEIVEDAWGWNEDLDNDAALEETADIPPPADETEIVDNAWDDDPWADDAPAPEPVPPPLASPPVKQAAGLAKKAKKGSISNAVVNGHDSHDTSTPTSNGHAAKVHFKAPPPLPPAAPVRRMVKKPKTIVTKEAYTVSGLMKELMVLVESILVESEEFRTSNLIPTSAGSSSASSSITSPGSILKSCISHPIDVFRAVYPVKFASELGLGAQGDKAMRFSNDCFYLNEQMDTIASVLQKREDGFEECRRRVKVLGESWFDDTVENRRAALNDILAQADGFVMTSDQDRYDECEAAVSGALQEIRSMAKSWKKILTKTKYYTAVGMVADSALSRVLDDILALPDIPEVESRRLSELCRIFNAIEGLFTDDVETPSSIVVWVPSWLKFSYLSELLEASMADILYLFNEGALVDFEIDELTMLVKALFADTQLRTNTINTILAGHPSSTT